MSSLFVNVTVVIPWKYHIAPAEDPQRCMLAMCASLGVFCGGAIRYFKGVITVTFTNNEDMIRYTGYPYIDIACNVNVMILFACAAWLLEMTHDLQRDSFTHLQVFFDSFVWRRDWFTLRHDLFTRWKDSHILWHDSFMFWCDSFKCWGVTWLIHVVTWLIQVFRCAMTRDVQRDSFACAAWLVRMFGLTHSHVRHGLLCDIEGDGRLESFNTCSTFKYVCIYIHMYMQIYIHVYTHTRKHAHAHTHIYIYIYAYIYKYIYIHIHIYIYIYICICTYIFTYIYKWEYTYVYVYT